MHRIQLGPWRLPALAVVLVGALLLSNTALASSLGDAVDNVDSQYNPIAKAMLGLSFLLGVVAVGIGLHKLKEASDGHGRATVSSGLWHIAAGAGLTALGAVMITSGDTLLGTGAANSASATSGIGGGGNNLGGMVVSVWNDIGPRLGGVFLLGTCSIMGAYFTFRGLMCLRDAAGGGASHGNLRASDGLVRIFAGAMSWNLPALFGIGLSTVWNGNDSLPPLAGSTAAAPVACFPAVTIACAANNVATNIVPVVIQSSFMFMYVVGAWMLARTIWRLAEAHQSGNPQLFQLKEGGHGFFMKMGMAILMLNMPNLLSAIENTFGIVASGGSDVITGSGFAAGSSILAYSGPVTVGTYKPLVDACFTILAMFGILTVWKGVRLWVHYADGDTKAFGAGMTHIVAGVLLTNSQWFLAMLANSVFGTAWSP